MLDREGAERLAFGGGQRPQRIEAGRLQPELGPGLEVPPRTRFDVGQEVGEAGVRILPLLDVALDAAKEGVLRHVGNQLTQNAGSLVVGDRIEVQVDGLDVGDIGRDRVGGGQLILAARAGLVLVGEGHPPILEACRLDLGEHRHKGCEALVQPEVIPPAHRDQVAEPHVGHLVENGVRAILADRLRHLGAKQHRLVEGDAADVFHGAGAELRDEELIVFLERIRVLVGLRIEVEPLFGDGKDLVRIEVGRE